MRFSRWLWLSLIVFTAHNLEEYWTIQQYFSSVRNRIPPYLLELIQPFTSDIFLTMIVMITILAAVMIHAGIAGGPGSWGMFGAMTWIMGGLLVNGIHHLGISFVSLGYTPGVVSSVVLLIPFGLYLWRRAYKEKLLAKRQLLWSLVAGAGLMLPVIVAVRALAALFRHS